MNVHLPKPGAYIVAVSGGVDSVCLLDIMSSYQDYDLIVAHFDHGIRPTSYQDLEFVKRLAEDRQLKFVSDSMSLGPDASEAEARDYRYRFLFRVQDRFKAVAVITAHHQDDRLETVILNLIRGTGRLGLSPMVETHRLKRPLITVSKSELISYALQHNLSWVEDITNTKEQYLRNYIRLNILSRISLKEKERLICLIDNQEKINQEIEGILTKLIGDDRGVLDRSTLNQLAYKESKELIAAWLRQNRLNSFNSKTLERITIAAKTKHCGSKIDVYNKATVEINKRSLALSTIER